MKKNLRDGARMSANCLKNTSLYIRRNQNQDKIEKAKTGKTQ